MKPLYFLIALTVASPIAMAAEREHPRLLIGVEDVELLRAKVEAAPFRQMLAGIRRSATTPVFPTPIRTRYPNCSKISVTFAAVRFSSKPNSGCMCKSRRQALNCDEIACAFFNMIILP